jgi:hypothetical protein
MNRLKRDLPIYALSVALIFLGITVSTNQASASNTSTVQVAKLQAQLNIANLRIQALRGDFTSYTDCADLNFVSIQTHYQQPNSFQVVRPCA